jgi:fructokinase
VSASPTEPAALVIGEALIDLIRRPGQPDDARVGGSPLNVAVGLSRLGLPATLLARTGADAHGQAIRQHLAANGVAMVEDSVSPRATSTAVATIEEDGSASYDFAIDGDLPPLTRPEPLPSVVHVGSIGAFLPPGAAIVDQALAELRSVATISYDPNVRPRLMGSPDAARPRVEALVAAADVVKVSSEDLEWLHPDDDPLEVADRWLHLGPALVVVTLGARGAYAVRRATCVMIPAEPTELLDTIGAGDSFTAGLLVALGDAGLLGRAQRSALAAVPQETLRSVLRFAATCSAITVSRTGANPPRRDELPSARPEDALR